MNLSERFARNRGAPQNVHGETVHPIYKREVRDRDTFAIHFLGGISEPIQGLSLSLKNGQLIINQERISDAVLWTDTAPAIVKIACATGVKDTGELHIWNCWRDENGTTQAWLGDAGMIIKDWNDGTKLRCSCGGTDGFSPTDLEVLLSIG